MPSPLPAPSLPALPPEYRGILRTDLDARAVYSESAGVGRILPTAVAVPADAEDVVTLVRWAAEHTIPLTPRGSASSMANGALGAGVIVDLGRLTTCGPVDVANRRVIVGPAVTRDHVEGLVNAASLTFPVDPSSSAFATIGGMCATNAAGARSVKHGAVRAWVQGLDCIFSNGSRAWIRRGQRVKGISPIDRFRYDAAPRIRELPATALRQVGVRKQSSGYGLAEWRDSDDIVDLIIGSEGTLAIIVGVELALAPLPTARAGLLAGFPDLEGAAAAAVRLAALGASAVELLDRSFLEIAASADDPLPVPLPLGLEAVLIVEVEATSEGMADLKLRDLIGWCEAGGAVHIEIGTDAETERRIWKLRHAASPILNKLAPQLQSMQLVEDGAVPPARFAEYVRGVRQALKVARLRGVIFGHAGDAHAHVNALVDMRESDWRLRIEQLVRDITALVASLGGTLAAEHGDGRLRAPLLAKVWPAATIAAFAVTKRAFDPKGILNPGVIVPEPGATALADVKYDPDLPPLPQTARDALDLVVREKAWDRHRLDLIGDAPTE